MDIWTFLLIVSQCTGYGCTPFLPLTDSFRAVQFLQTGLFIGLGVWVIIELSLISDIAGPAAAALFAVPDPGLPFLVGSSKLPAVALNARSLELVGASSVQRTMC